MTTRAEVVEAARKYLGARWQHQARGDHALDCVGLLVRVGRDLGIADVRVSDYVKHPDGARLLQEAGLYMRQIEKRNFAVGDALAMRFGSGAPQHFGIVGDYFAGGFSLIHAYRGVSMVVEHRLDDVWRRRIVAAYALPGVE